MAFLWLTLDAALDLIGRDQQGALARAIQADDIRTRQRYADGRVADLHPSHWCDAPIDWQRSRLAITGPSWIWILDGRGGALPEPPHEWVEVEVERRSLLAAFGQAEPAPVRIVGPVSVWLVEKLRAALGMKPADRQPRRWSGYNDDELLDEMSALLKSGEASSDWDAAKQVADRAKGGGTQEAKAKRLATKFSSFQK